MITSHTPKTLRAFADDIAAEFNAGKIRAPIHLDAGNEAGLIREFADVRPQDWVCGSWRMMSKALLKGVPADRLKAEVMAGRSITLTFPDYRVISSAIVAGILPIAVGLAWEIKRARRDERVFAFLGDMTLRTGGAIEAMLYAGAWGLPIRFIIEDNGKSVLTDTAAVWNGEHFGSRTEVAEFSYVPVYPHAGAGKRVEF